MKITKEQVKEFIDGISEGEKVAVLHHDDLDGFASGILVYDYIKKKGVNVEAFVVGLQEENFNYLSDYDKVVTVDLASSNFGKFFEKFSDKLIVIDHHPENYESERLREYNDSNEGYIPTSRTVYEILGGKQWFSVAGVISDAGHLYEENKNFINEFLEKENLNLEDFRINVVDVLSYVLIYLKKDFTKAFDLIQGLDSYNDIEKLKEYYGPIKEEVDFSISDFEKNKEQLGKIVFYYFEPKFKVKPVVINAISIPDENNLFVFASPSSQEGIISLSARNEFNGLTANEVLKKGVAGLDGAWAGGHMRASGGIIQAKDLEKFKDNLRNL